MPQRIFISVDLPAPFSPSKACTSPAWTSSDTSCRALTPGNDFEMCLRESNGVMGIPSCAAQGGTRCQRLRSGLPAEVGGIVAVDQLHVDGDLCGCGAGAPVFGQSQA